MLDPARGQVIRPGRVEHARPLRRGTQETSGIELSACPTLEVRAIFEFLIARVYFGACQRAKTVYSELFAAEAAHDRAVDYRAAEIGVRDLAIAGVDALSGEVSDEAAGEAVACAGGIEDLLQQISRDHEVAV